jgi:uncharacterized protein with NRDE domain
MCTLIALHRSVPGASLVVAANRDEFYGRPAEGPALRRTASGWIAAPLDVEAGGTWLGLNPAGVFAAVTNVAGGARDPERRSRGLMLVEALAATCAREAMEKAVNLPVAAYNPFNLLLADRHDLFALTYRDSARPVSPQTGPVVVGNSPLDEAPPPKLARLRRRLEEVARGPAPALLEGLGALCRDHEAGERGALDALCVHTPGYGTRSSALLWLGEAGLEDPTSALHFAQDAPCRSPYEDFTPLLGELASARGGSRGV